MFGACACPRESRGHFSLDRTGIGLVDSVWVNAGNVLIYR